MRLIPLAATLAALAGPAILAPAAADDATTPAATAAPAPPTAPAATGTARITKSRSNIQNNREATPPTDAGTTSPAEPATTEVLKTKTKSNQSND